MTETLLLILFYQLLIMKNMTYLLIIYSSIKLKRYKKIEKKNKEKKH